MLARLSSAILFILLAGPLAALTPVWDTYAPADSFLRGLAAQANAEPYPWTLNGDRIYVLQNRSLVALSASAGSLLWQREVGKSATLALLADGGVAVASDGQYPASVGVVQLRRYSPSGNILWQRGDDPGRDSSIDPYPDTCERYHRRKPRRSSEHRF